MEKILNISEKARVKQNVPINLWTIISGANHPGIIITFTANLIFFFKCMFVYIQPSVWLGISFS